MKTPHHHIDNPQSAVKPVTLVKFTARLLGEPCEWRRCSILRENDLIFSFKPITFIIYLSPVQNLSVGLTFTCLFQGQPDWAKVAPLSGPKLPHGGLRKISKKWLILVSIHVDFLKEGQKCKKI